MPAEETVAVPMDLLLELHSGLEVLKSRQTEINRRIGLLEGSLEEDKESGSRWHDWFWQAVWWAIGITVVVAVGRFFGVEVVFG